MNSLKAFQEMDANSDGRVTQEEFVKACLNQATISKMLALKVIDVFTGSEGSKWKTKNMFRMIVSYVSSLLASHVFYFLIPRSATFSLTNLAKCRFSRFATKQFTWFSIATFFCSQSDKIASEKIRGWEIMFKVPYILTVTYNLLNVHILKILEYLVSKSFSRHR